MTSDDDYTTKQIIKITKKKQNSRNKKKKNNIENFSRLRNLNLIRKISHGNYLTRKIKQRPKINKFFYKELCSWFNIKNKHSIQISQENLEKKPCNKEVGLNSRSV